MKKNLDLILFFVCSILLSVFICYLVLRKNSLPVRVNAGQYSVLEKFAVKNEYTIIEFMDYQCPPCRLVYPNIKKIVHDSPVKINISICHFPLSFHSQAIPCIYAVEYARRYGKFQEMHDALMVSEKLDDEAITAIFKRLSIPYKAELWKKDRDIVKIIDQCKVAGTSIGVKGTPSIFLYTPQGEIYIIKNPSQIGQLVK